MESAESVFFEAVRDDCDFSRVIGGVFVEARDGKEEVLIRVESGEFGGDARKETGSNEASGIGQVKVRLRLAARPNVDVRLSSVEIVSPLISQVPASHDTYPLNTNKLCGSSSAAFTPASICLTYVFPSPSLPLFKFHSVSFIPRLFPPSHIACPATTTKFLNSLNAGAWL